MKSVEEITCCVCDYGSFLSLAEKLGETVKKCYYYSPFETEFQEAKKCIIGTGLPNVERCDEPLDPDFIKECNLWVYPDIAFGGQQRLLRSMGKAVWGSMGASDYELYRTRFLKMLEEVGLPAPPSKVVRGVSNLASHLKGVTDKWIKVNRFRSNMETWHHIDYEHSLPMLNWLAVEFGGVADNIVFVVQDPIPDAQEVGYDGFSVDGQFPSRSFQGYEKKNELYLGSWLEAKEMPPQVQTVNRAMAPLLEEIGYRNFFATEIRDEYFIDPTMRQAGQTQEHYQETCKNLAEIIWQGANGVLVEPEFEAKFCAEATLHYKPGTDNWMVLKIPDEVRRWVKLYYYCLVDGIYRFPPHDTNEVGVIVRYGDTVEQAIDNVKETLEALEAEPVSAEIEGFVDLVKEIKEAQAAGVKFSDKPLPKPEALLT